VVFIEVAIITLLRQLIVEPVQVATTDMHLNDFNIAHYGLVLAALLIVGILHKLISSSDAAKKPGEPV
ncbi:MAG TPA: hypothetical protein VK000_09885, partial [Luteimonas sp.]|nr:hypothetical protein [Luteimonas sp.]